MPESTPRVDKYSAVIAATAANADFEVVICEAPYAGTLTSASYVTDTAVTGANTDSRTAQVINKGQAGSGTTVMASKAFLSGTNATAFDETALTLSSTAADLVVAEGDVITFKSLHVGGTGLADPGGTAWIEITRA
jgi:hypothetical protein